MNIGEAVDLLRAGKRVARAHWAREGAWVFLVPGSTFTVAADRPMGKANPELVGRDVSYRTHIDVHNVDGSVEPWFATSADLLAADWYEVPAS